MPRSTGASQRWRPSYTDTRYSPSGLATAKMVALKKRICNHPLMVMSEFLRAEERVDEVDQHGDRDRQGESRLGAHFRVSIVAVSASLARPMRSQKAT